MNRSIVAELHDDLAAEHAPVDPERLVSEVARRRPLLGEDERADRRLALAERIRGDLMAGREAEWENSILTDLFDQLLPLARGR